MKDFDWDLEIEQPTDEYVLQFYNIVIDHILRQIFLAQCQPNSTLNFEYGYGGLKLFQNEFLNENVVKRLRFIFFLVKKYNIRINMFCESGGNIIGLTNWALFSVWECCNRCGRRWNNTTNATGTTDATASTVAASADIVEEIPITLTFCPLEETNVKFLDKKYERVCDLIWSKMCSSCEEAFLIINSIIDVFTSSVYSDLSYNCFVRSKKRSEGRGRWGEMIEALWNLLFKSKTMVLPQLNKRKKFHNKKQQNLHHRYHHRHRYSDRDHERNRNRNNNRNCHRPRSLAVINIRDVQKYFFSSYLKTLISCKNSFRLMFLKMRYSIRRLLLSGENFDNNCFKINGSFSLIPVMFSKTTRKCVFVEIRSPLKFFQKDEIFNIINSAIDFTGWFNVKRDIVDVPVFYGNKLKFDNVKIIQMLKTGDNFSFSYTPDSLSVFKEASAVIIGNVTTPY